MTDRELLELAAKAAGLTNPQYEQSVAANWNIYHGDIVDPRECWNPLADDGDALRLAVKIGFVMSASEKFVKVSLTWSREILEYANGDILSATRRAIVRAAAEIGKGME